MKFWTPKFALALALTVLFVLVALKLGLATDPETGDPMELMPGLARSNVASFLFLLLVLYVISHAGGWVLGKFRDRGKSEPAEEKPRGRKRGRRAPGERR